MHSQASPRNASCRLHKVAEVLQLVTFYFRKKKDLRKHTARDYMVYGNMLSQLLCQNQNAWKLRGATKQ